MNVNLEWDLCRMQYICFIEEKRFVRATLCDSPQKQVASSTEIIGVSWGLESKKGDLRGREIEPVNQMT